jgi:hypothetical protein
MTNLPRVVAIRRADTGFAGRADPLARDAFARSARLIARHERQARRLREGASLESVLEGEGPFADLEHLIRADQAGTEQWERSEGLERAVWSISYRICRRLMASPLGHALRWLDRAFTRKR